MKNSLTTYVNDSFGFYKNQQLPVCFGKQRQVLLDCVLTRDFNVRANVPYPVPSGFWLSRPDRSEEGTEWGWGGRTLVKMPHPFQRSKVSWKPSGRSQPWAYERPLGEGSGASAVHDMGWLNAETGKHGI